MLPPTADGVTVFTTARPDGNGERSAAKVLRVRGGGASVFSGRTSLPPFPERRMATVRPFRAHRPPPALAGKVASPPYDVVSTREARALAAGNADSFLRVSRPEIDLPEGTDEHADAVYAKGAENLGELVRRGVLVQDSEPRLYVYAQQ